MNTFQSIASIFAIVVGLITVTVTLYNFFTGKVNFKDKADPQIAQKRKTYWVPLFIAAGAIVVVVVVLFLTLPVGFFTTSGDVDSVEKKSPDVLPPVVEKPPKEKDNPDGSNPEPDIK